MQTVEEVLSILNNIDRFFKNNHELALSLKIDLFMNTDDGIFFEALRRNEVSLEDFRTISCTRHYDKKYRKGNSELLKQAITIYAQKLMNDN